MKKLTSMERTVKKVDVQSTLLSIPVGEELIIKTRIIKASSIRSAIRYLNQKGYMFASTEKGLIDEVKVFRKE